jgi:sarcosine oxidase
VTAPASGTYDVVVAGLGGMGSAAAAHLARRGVRVLGLDPNPPAHDQGASHGETRIVRQVYFEGAGYVPMLLRSTELWGQLERDAGVRLVTRCGALFLGDPRSRVFSGSLSTAEHWDLPHEQLDHVEIAERFPAFRPAEAVGGIYEASAGFTRPEHTVAAHLRLAAEAGAELRHGEPLVSWDETADGGVAVRTEAGSYSAGHLVVAPGRWAPELLAGRVSGVDVQPRTQHWFVPDGDATRVRPDRMPAWVWEREDGTETYGAPLAGPPEGGVKLAIHHCRTKAPAEFTVDEVRAAVEPVMPGVAHRHVRSVACWYAMTPDEAFVLGAMPGSAGAVTVACGFSGHGFKFAPVVGEVLADLATTGSSRFDLAMFDPLRPALAG